MQNGLELSRELSHCAKFIWCKTKCFPALLSFPEFLLISTFDIAFAINLLVCYLFRKCFAMFLIFTFLRTRKTLCEAHTSHLFSFFQDTASPSLIRHTTTSSQILLVKEGKQYFQRECLLCTHLGFQEAPCFPFSMFDKTFPPFCLVILKSFFPLSLSF